jgi:hypothetical protein
MGSPLLAPLSRSAESPRFAGIKASIRLLLLGLISTGLLAAAKAHPDHHQPSHQQQQAPGAAEHEHQHQH